QGDLDVALGADEACVFVGVLEARPAALGSQFGTAAAGGEYVVVELVAEYRELAAHAAAGQAQERVEPEPGLLAEARVAHVVGVGGEVRSVGVELVEVGRAVGATRARAYAHLLRDQVQQPERAGERAEAAWPDGDPLAAGQHE